MIEVEKKFIPTEEQLKSMLEGAEFLGEKNLEDFYYDYPAAQQLTGATLSSTIKVIFERITQDIFNESLAKW